MTDELENNLKEGESNMQEEPSIGRKSFIVIPILLGVFFFVSFTQVGSKESNYNKTQISDNRKAPNVNFSALLAAEQFSKNLRDTIYTNDDLWLELRIDQQILYVHYKDGRIVKYPVSSGNPHASKSVESRPGLYSIFLKEEVHLSSQFNDARMNYFMPYNMGIGFHGLQGTGYYGHLGVRPSSHGCIRMRNEDVKVLFGQCKIGTLVLSHRGKSTRVVAFAPEGFKNDAEYTKDDYMNIMAYNLSSLMEGKYFTNPPKRFVLDGTVIPRIGINVKTTDEIPERQMLPFAVFTFESLQDKLKSKSIYSGEIRNLTNTEFTENEVSKSDSTLYSSELGVSPDMVKKYVYNPIGILPYFPPNR